MQFNYSLRLAHGGGGLDIDFSQTVAVEVPEKKFSTTLPHQGERNAMLSPDFLAPNGKLSPSKRGSPDAGAGLVGRGAVAGDAEPPPARRVRLFEPPGGPALQNEPSHW